MGIKSTFLASASAPPDEEPNSGVNSNTDGHPFDEHAPLLELRRVSKVFGIDEDSVLALDEIDLQVEFGEFVAVMGASRSGKSTCMNILGCLDTPSAGTYRFCGVPVEKMGSDEQAKLRKRYVGFLFSRPGLLSNATVLENVEQPLFNRGLSDGERVESALAALACVGLQRHAHLRLPELSQMEQQRVAVARAVATSPAVLLVDDPTANLDASNRVELMHLLATLNAELKLTIVLMTHRLETAAFADRIVRLEYGRVVSEQRRAAAAS